MNRYRNDSALKDWIRERLWMSCDLRLLVGQDWWIVDGNIILGNRICNYIIYFIIRCCVVYNIGSFIFSEIILFYNFHYAVINRRRYQKYSR